jgi:hypothetical protein
MRELIRLLLVALAYLLIGGLVGALIYAKEGATFFSGPGTWIYDFQGLLGGLFTVGAAIIAWAAVRYQVAAEDRRQRKADVRRKVAVADMLTTMLLSTASELGSDDYLGRVTNIAASVREALLDVMTINGNLGAAISLYVTELDRFCRERDGLATLKSIAEQSERRDSLERQRKPFAFRCFVGASCFNHASAALDGAGRLPAALISDAEVTAATAKYGTKEADLLWAKMAFVPRVVVPPPADAA